MRIRFPVLAGLVSLATTCCLGEQILPRISPKHTAIYHNQDLSLFLGGYNDTELGNIARRISKDIDNATWFRKEVGNLKGLPWKGNHRNIGHSAPFGKNIPSEHPSTIAIEKKYGKSGIMKVNAHQMEKGNQYINEIMMKTGFSKRQARAFMNLVPCFHYCGDGTIDNRILNLVMNFDGISVVSIDSLKVLFSRKDPAYFTEFKRRILMIKNGKMPVKDKVFAFMKLFRDMKFDEALNRNYGKTLSKTGNVYDGKAASNANRLYQEKYRNQKMAYGLKNRGPHQKGRGRTVKRYSAEVKLKNASIMANTIKNSSIRQRGRGVRLIKRYSASMQLKNVSKPYASGVPIRAGAGRIMGGFGSAAMIAAPSLGGFRAGKTTMDVAVDAGVMVAGYSASQSASAMMGGMIGTGGSFAVAMVVQTIVAKIAYGFYERYQNVRREQRDIGVLKARIDLLRRDDGLLDQMVERAIKQEIDFK